MNDIIRSLITPLLGAFCLGGIVALQLSASPLKTEKTLTTEEYQKQEQIQRTRIEVLKKIPSLGFKNLQADLVLLDFIQYYGDAPARDTTGYSLVPNYFEAVAQHDPRFVHSFLYLAPATSLFAGRPDRSVQILTEITQSLSPEIPDAYLVWDYKAVDELLFLGDSESARQSYQKVAEWAAIRDTETSRNIGNRAAQTAKFLADNPDSKRAQASSWLMIFGNAREEEVRQLALQQIEKLGGRVEVSNGLLTVELPETD